MSSRAEGPGAGKHKAPPSPADAGIVEALTPSCLSRDGGRGALAVGECGEGKDARRVVVEADAGIVEALTPRPLPLTRGLWRPSPPALSR